MSQPLPSTSCDDATAPKRCKQDTKADPPCLPLNLWRLHSLIDDDSQAIAFCQSYGLLPRHVACPTCESQLNTYHKKNRAGRAYYYFACNKRGCRQASTPNEVALKKGTWFEGSKISMQKSLILAYCFSRKMSNQQTIIETSLTDLTSSQTVVDYFNYCREVCMESLYEVYDGSEAKQIGGPNCTVEIDEAKFVERKFNRGRLVEGQWVLGGLCRENKECFLVPVNDRTEETLVDLIKRFVRRGSIIHTDCFASYSYNKLQQEGYQHLTVNHSENVVDPETGACTILIENTWWTVRKTLPSCSKKYFAHYLAEYMWRKTHQEGDIYLAFLRAIKEVYPGPQR